MQKTFANPSRKGVENEKGKAIEETSSYIKFSYLLLPMGEKSFSSKFKIRDMLSRLFEYIFRNKVSVLKITRALSLKVH